MRTYSPITRVPVTPQTCGHVDAAFTAHVTWNGVWAVLCKEVCSNNNLSLLGNQDILPFTSVLSWTLCTFSLPSVYQKHTICSSSKPFCKHALMMEIRHALSLMEMLNLELLWHTSSEADPSLALTGRDSSWKVSQKLLIPGALPLNCTIWEISNWLIFSFEY